MFGHAEWERGTINSCCSWEKRQESSWCRLSSERKILGEAFCPDILCRSKCDPQDRSSGLEEKSKLTEMSFFPYDNCLVYAVFSLIMLSTIKQQCHKPTDWHIILRKNEIMPLLFLWVLWEGVSWFYPGYSQLWLLPLPHRALWKSQMVHS